MEGSRAACPADEPSFLQQHRSPSSVLPVPGGPLSSTPDGIWAPSLENLELFFRQATTCRAAVGPPSVGDGCGPWGGGPLDGHHAPRRADYDIATVIVAPGPMCFPSLIRPGRETHTLPHRSLNPHLSQLPFGRVHACNVSKCGGRHLAAAAPAGLALPASEEASKGLR